MTKENQKQFVESLCNSIKLELISKIEGDLIPGTWDGMELRELIAEKAERETYLRRSKRDKRYREYANHVLINMI